MKIVFLIRSLIYYTSELANALARCGNEVVTILPADGWDVVVPEGEDVRQYLRSLLDPRVDVRFVAYTDTNLKNLAENIACARRIAGLLRECKPDIIHLQDACDYRYILALHMIKHAVPVVDTIHDASPHPGYSYNSVSLLMRRITRRRAAKIIIHGEGIKQSLIQQGFDPAWLAVIPHGSYSWYTRWRCDEKEEPCTILAFGNIYEYKGLEYLVQAEPLIRSQIPGLKIIVAGSGSHWANVEPLIRDPDSFELHIRKIPDKEVARLFQRAAVVVLPYIEASQSGVLNIANAFGKPVVATNVGSLPEAVHDGITGIIVPPKDSQALADAIVKLLKDPEMRQAMGAKAYEEATTGDFSWDNIACKTVEVYKEAISGFRCRR